MKMSDMPRYAEINIIADIKIVNNSYENVEKINLKPIKLHCAIGKNEISVMKLQRVEDGSEVEWRYLEPENITELEKEQLGIMVRYFLDEAGV